MILRCSEWLSVFMVSRWRWRLGERAATGPMFGGTKRNAPRGKSRADINRQRINVMMAEIRVELLANGGHISLPYFPSSISGSLDRMPVYKIKSTHGYSRCTPRTEHSIYFTVSTASRRWVNHGRDCHQPTLTPTDMFGPVDQSLNSDDFSSFPLAMSCEGLGPI